MHRQFMLRKYNSTESTLSDLLPCPIERLHSSYRFVVRLEVVINRCDKLLLLCKQRVGLCLCHEVAIGLAFVFA
jgi:hypothetical protein